MLNKWVFSAHLKDSVVPCVLTDTGKLFQMWGPVDANEDDLQSSFLQNLGTMLVNDDSCNLLELCLVWIRSWRYFGAFPHLYLKASSAILYVICSLIFSQWNLFIPLLTWSYFPRFATILHDIFCTLCSLLSWFEALPMRVRVTIAQFWQYKGLRPQFWQYLHQGGLSVFECFFQNSKQLSTDFVDVRSVFQMTVCIK